MTKRLYSFLSWAAWTIGVTNSRATSYYSAVSRTASTKATATRTHRQSLSRPACNGASQLAFCRPPPHVINSSTSVSKISQRRTFSIVSQRNMTLVPDPTSKHEPLPHKPARDMQMGDARFGRFIIPEDCIFYRSDTGLSLAFVNLRPIIPGHVLVIPHRATDDKSHPIARMSDLNEHEYLDLWQTVRRVQQLLAHHYQCTDFNVAVQDGKAAGQSVPHVHVHILPRTPDDAYAGDDAIYTQLEEWAPKPGTTPLSSRMTMPEERVDRTAEAMALEAGTYRAIWQQLRESSSSPPAAN